MPPVTLKQYKVNEVIADFNRRVAMWGFDKALLMLQADEKFHLQTGNYAYQEICCNALWLIAGAKG